MEDIWEGKKKRKEKEQIWEATMNMTQYIVGQKTYCLIALDYATILRRVLDPKFPLFFFFLKFFLPVCCQKCKARRDAPSKWLKVGPTIQSAYNWEHEYWDCSMGNSDTCQYNAMRCVRKEFLLPINNIWFTSYCINSFLTIQIIIVYFKWKLNTDMMHKKK